MDETNKSVKPHRPGMWQRAAVLFSGARLVLVLLGFILDSNGD